MKGKIMVDLASYTVGSIVRGRATVRESKTSPPKPFVEGDLILIMDDIGRYAQIGKEDAAILREKNASGSGKAGIGTARTRGEIIKKLLSDGFLEKQEKGKIVPTAKSIDLFNNLNKGKQMRSLLSPEMTAKWETGLAKIEAGEITLEQFIKQLNLFLIALTDDIFEHSTIRHSGHGKTCTKCGKAKYFSLIITNPKSNNYGKKYLKCRSCSHKVFSFE